MIKNLCLWSISIGVTATAVPAQPTIDRLAPADSVFLANLSSVQRSMERLKGTQLWTLWQSAEVMGLREKIIEACEEHLDEFFEELGVDQETLPLPQGDLGVAVFPVESQAGGVSVGFLLLGDFGDNADAASGLVDAGMELAEAEGDLEYAESELLGRTVLTFDLSDIDVVGLDDLPMVDPADLLEAITKLHFVRDGSRFMLCSDMGSLRAALEVVDGDDRAGFADEEEFRAVREQLGEVDGYAVLLTGKLTEMLAAGNPMGMMIQQMVTRILGDIRAVGAGFRLGGPSLILQERFAVYMPDGTAGLTALVDFETPRRDLPSFVAPDAVAYSSMNFEFDGVMGFFRDLGRADPMLGAQLDMFLVEHGARIEQVCAALGPQIHNVVTLKRPINLGSLKTLTAIRSQRPGQVEAVLAEFAPAMGMEPRDFLGHRIYTLGFNPFMLGMPQMPGGDQERLSIGFGGGYVMIGATSMVEDALRATGRQGLPTLADDVAMRRAIRALPGRNAIAWGLMNVVDYLEYFKNFNAMIQDQMLGQMREFDPRMAAQMEAEQAAREQFPLDEIDLELLKRYLGPVAWQIRAHEEGFVGSSYLFEAPAQDR